MNLRLWSKSKSKSKVKLKKSSQVKGQAALENKQSVKDQLDELIPQSTKFYDIRTWKDDHIRTFDYEDTVNTKSVGSSVIFSKGQESIFTLTMQYSR